MALYFTDIEADGYLEDATKVHCLSFKSNTGTKPLTILDNFKDFFDIPIDGDTIIFHNGFGYDLPLLRKLGHLKSYDPLHNTVNKRHIQVIDTLALSRYWWPDNPNGHSLDAWAKRLGTYKKPIDDWHNLPIEEYVERCENDVLTTEKVFEFLADKLEIELSVL